MNVRIARIETFAVRYPTRGRFKFFEDAQGRPIGRPAVVIRITADNGTEGWGQSVPTPKWSYETLETVLTTIEHHLAPVLMGLDPFDVDLIHSVMNQTIAPSFSTGQPICKAGLDTALFDLTGRILGQSARARWGATGPDRIPLSWTLNPKTLEDVEPLIAQGISRGYRHFNVKVAPDPEFDIALCRRVRQLVPEGFLWADANGGYEEATALFVAPKLADIGVPVLEQPLPANRLGGYQRLKKQGALPIIMDEGIVSCVELDEFIRLKLLDGVAMKPARCGGVTEAARQIKRVLESGLMFLGSGLTDPDLALAAAASLYAAFDLQYPAALNGPQFLEGNILQNPLEILNGELIIPSGPGLGVQVDLEKLEQLRIDPKRA
ncbi:MAG: mandelate racemase [Verrucomicrobia bacterium]|jgi:L-alanine-DL-glutamate epimerase-like enolase superfamily enzyme|nr:mandelate racemase [Verrucomicrobiota bacterium]